VCQRKLAARGTGFGLRLHCGGCFRRRRDPSLASHGRTAFPILEDTPVTTYLVTGGAGFIGSHLAEALIGRGAQVRVVDSFVTGKRENLAHLPGIPLLEGDLADLEVARRAVAGVEYVLHQAAIPSVPRSVADPIGSHRANVDATLNVLVAARDAGVRRVIYAGSSSAYGDTPTLPKSETMPPNPLSPYALQKLVGERYCQMFTALYVLDTVTIRYFNVFGPRQDPSSPYSGVISRFVTALLEGQSPTIYGDGKQTRDFTYVANVVDGVLRACTAPEVSGQVINVATGGRISLNELLAVLCDLQHVKISPLYADGRRGDVKHSQADISRARRLLG
jgi:nucleoside-diphosphate-sugar epimerase